MRQNDRFTEEKQPRVLQMSAAKEQLALFARGLPDVLATIDQNDQVAELRLSRVPAFNFEAGCINYEGEPGDKPMDTCSIAYVVHSTQRKLCPSRRTGRFTRSGATLSEYGRHNGSVKGGSSPT
ncbi:MAG: hypothetical protein H0U72_02190 [Nitrosospira sp.]|nr:hypothetical protein [Nitrosospira sp.]